MLSTRERTATATTDVGSSATAAPRSDTRAWLLERIPAEAAMLVAAAWVVLYSIATALEPTAAHADVVPAWLETGLGVVLLGLFAVTTAGLVARRRWGLVGSMAGAVFLVALAIACPVTGHHTLGAWWFGQMACVAGLVGVSAYALRRA